MPNLLSYKKGFLFNNEISIDICRKFCHAHFYSWLKKGFDISITYFYLISLFLKKNKLKIIFSIYLIEIPNLNFRLECICSDTLEDLHRIDSNSCNLKCHGNNKQICCSKRTYLAYIKPRWVVKSRIR